LFFAAFFGLCLTDAGYGFILIVVAIFFAYKMKPSRNFLMLILFGGIFTVFAGTIFNGWFGDLPGYFGLGDFFMRFAILGDPINSTYGAMNFFRLALVLGVIQVIFGLFIKFFDALRRKELKEAFFDALTWIVIVLSLVVILLSTQIAVSMQLVDAPMFDPSVARYLVWILLPAAIAVIFFSARDEKSWGFRLFMGFLNLTVVNGLTSYLGDILSYIRLMALGLVTAGIGVAINQIAFQMLTIPVIGIAVTIIALVFGHTFNIGINILGAFVHTMRLRYVEFFQKFYVGGGKPFEALKTEHNYITLVDD
jgi:V/A-type H+-transporting ATPase subunit I